MDAQPAFFQPGAFFFFLKMPMQWDRGVRRTPQTWLLITTATVTACLEDAREGAQVGDTVPGTSASRVNTDAGHTGKQPDSEVFTPKTRPARTRSDGDSRVGLDSGDAGAWPLRLCGHHFVPRLAARGARGSVADLMHVSASLSASSGGSHWGRRRCVLKATPESIKIQEGSHLQNTG